MPTAACLRLATSSGRQHKHVEHFVCTNDLLMQELPDAVGSVSMAVDPGAVCCEESCCICFESPLREPTRTKCNHWFCWSVITPACPIADESATL